MAITNKFPYTSLIKQATSEGRKYVTPDGSPLPSVTTILAATKSEEDKKVLLNWKKRVGETKAREITTEAAGRGTRMHKWLENYIKDDILGEAGTNPYSIQSHRMANIIVDSGLANCSEFWGTEISLYFPQIYAGTADLLGIHSNSEAIMDFKQTNRPKKKEWITDYFIQLAAYAECHNELYNTNIKKGVIFMCSANFDYQEFVIENNEFDHYKDMWWKKVEEYYKKFI